VYYAKGYSEVKLGHLDFSRLGGTRRNQWRRILIPDIVHRPFNN
jgi:hypothetical protein